MTASCLILKKTRSFTGIVGLSTLFCLRISDNELIPLLTRTPNRRRAPIVPYLKSESLHVVTIEMGVGGGGESRQLVEPVLAGLLGFY